MVGLIMLLQIFSWFWKWKNFENRLIFDKVKAFNKNYALFGGRGTLYFILYDFDLKAKVY